MHRSAISTAAFLALLLFGFAATPAIAHAQDTDVEPDIVAPLPLTSVHMVGDVFANGQAIGAIDFAIVWSEEDPSEVQLWALFNDAPTAVCFGQVFETPTGEPIFFGTTSLMDPEGTCHMSQLPDRSGISLFAASSDGQWAASILRSPNRADTVPIFE